MKITVEHNPIEQELKILNEGIESYSRRILPEENTRDIIVFLRDDRNHVVGGLIGRTRWNTFFIDDLWIEEKYRKKGHGSELVTKAEEMAIQMGCRTSMTGTFESYGARPFYQKLGYKIVSSDHDSPVGQIGYWFHKSLKK
jgi:GNAT superfamily N-acetyltransferase